MVTKTAQARETMEVSFTVNGEETTIETYPMRRLLDVLREDIDLTGTKEGCGEGECGACTVIMNDEPVLTCMVPICQADGAEIITIEGLGGDEPDELHPMQEAFYEEGGAQCGICTPGMIISAAYYLDNPDVAEDMREALAGNQCRCTGYPRIF
ncbi:MAG: (2Fe-2S)-binding protein [bacterium]